MHQNLLGTPFTRQGWPKRRTTTALFPHAALMTTVVHRTGVAARATHAVAPRHHSTSTPAGRFSDASSTPGPFARAGRHGNRYLPHKTTVITLLETLPRVFRRRAGPCLRCSARAARNKGRGWTHCLFYQRLHTGLALTSSNACGSALPALHCPIVSATLRPFPSQPRLRWQQRGQRGRQTPGFERPLHHDTCPNRDPAVP